MMRRSMAVIKENVYESVAQGSLVRKEKKRSNRSELEIVKTQEKFGTKHQRPCALCEQSFSEVNLVLAVPFKVENDAIEVFAHLLGLRIAYCRKPSRSETSRTGPRNYTVSQALPQPSASGLTERNGVIAEIAKQSSVCIGSGHKER